MGFVEVTKDRTSSETTVAIKEMERDLHTAGPDPKPLVRVHHDQDTSFLGRGEEDLGTYLLDEKIRQTDTGGHRPSNNAHTEKRIGLVIYCFRAILYTATGGGRYYDQLTVWGPGIKHANNMVNYAPWSDGVSPYEKRSGRKYQFGKDDHIFGAKCLYWVKKEHRDSKFANPGAEAIWVGRSSRTPGSHIVVPYKWDGGSQRYILGETLEVPSVDVNNSHFPLR